MANLNHKSLIQIKHLLIQLTHNMNFLIYINIQIYKYININVINFNLTNLLINFHNLFPYLLKMKSAVKEDQKQRPSVDPRQVHQLYSLSHQDLQLTLKRLKEKLFKQFQEFSTKLVCGLNHLNYIRYNKAYPQDDIKFVFREKNNISANDNRFEQKEQIMQRMINFEVLKFDYCGVSDNCIYEIQKFITDNNFILNFKQCCPSGLSFINQHQDRIQQYIPYWQQQTGPMDLTAMFNQVSDHFPKDQIKNLGVIFSQADIKISGAKLIFRASQHNFQSASFKDHCVGRAPTLLIAKSEKGLIFGGYTPCKWLKTKQQQFVSDPNGKSFLFSLTKKMIFPIKQSQKNYAISAYGGWGPIFGSPYGPDLSIADKCHINQHSCSSLGSHYEIPPNIKQYSNEAYSLLAGGKNFKALQYEIYELEIQ